MRRFSLLFFIFIPCLLFNLAVRCALAAPKNPSIRIAVFKDVDSVTLALQGAYIISDAVSNKQLIDGKNLNKANIAPSDSGISLGENLLNSYRVLIKPQQDSSVYINNRRFRGAVKVIQTDQKKLIVVNEVDIENYLRGVLYHEVSHRWPLEAIKAQAIVSRTFALYQAQQNAAVDFDMTADVYSQMYGGAYSEKYRTDKAITATKGMVLMYKGKMLPAYFHATCGGKTEDVSRLWKNDELPLKGIECNFCKSSKHFKWQAKMSVEDLREKLKSKGFDSGAIKEIIIKKRNSSNRIEQIDITGDTNTISISGKDFRQLIGPNLIRSTNFEVAIKDNNVEFNGFGWGHGVGMCQWGAYYMAKKKYKAEQILQFYYPGAEVITLQ